jgi:glycosyltransferase involved in cell wall biosynthesis
MQKVTILIPNYKTLELTKLCLRLIRKHTDLNLAKVIVIDNDSQDESLDYLRTVKWIHLIERKSVPGETPGLSHSRALDEALATVTTPYVLSIHTDTLVRNQQWLPFLIQQIEKNPNIAGVGSWKLEQKPLIKRVAKMIEQPIQLAFYRLIGKKNHGIQGKDHNHYYLRSHCALYRANLLNQYQLKFSENNEVAGKGMHRGLVERGHEMVFLPSEILLKYMDHINHGTIIINPELSSDRRSVTRGQKRIEQSLASFNAYEILQDNSLDQ